MSEPRPGRDDQPRERSGGPHDAAQDDAAPQGRRREVQRVSLEKETDNTLQEARVVLPGIQTLFGFQLIAVFNQRFTDLAMHEQYLHLGALVLVACAVALIMAPAAHHRLADRGTVSRHLVDLSSRYIASALLPLMLGIDLDIYIVCRLVTGSTGASLAIAATVLAVLALVWFVLPWQHSHRRDDPAGRT